MPKPRRRIRMGSRAPLPVRPLLASGNLLRGLRHPQACGLARFLPLTGSRTRASRALTPLLLAPLSLGGLTLASALPARAELAPWVYGEQQRRAPLVVDLRVLEVAPLPAGAEGLRLRGRVLAVRRQARGGGVRTDQVLTLRLPPLPRATQPPMVGPAPLRPPVVGSRVTAWLQPAPERAALWLPAAGGRSFGPSLETSLDPNATAPAAGAVPAGAVPAGAPR